MPLIRYFKSSPNDYILFYCTGAVRRERAGIPFFCWAWATGLARVSVGTVDRPIILNFVIRPFAGAQFA